MIRKIKATWMRGGTSKGLFFQEKDLPLDQKERDQCLLRAIGSPDPYGKQIDGVGGATSSTSKIVIISPSTRPDCDVNYNFGAVDITQPLIDYSGSCANLISAVGPFAMEEGLVQAQGDMTIVNIWQVNTQKKIIAHIPTQNARPQSEGTYMMDGVSFSGAPIRLEFLEPGGSPDGSVLPTGNPQDSLDIEGFGQIEATLVYAGNPMVFIRAEDLGLTATEQAGDAALTPEMYTLLEKIRAMGAYKMGLVSSPEEATKNRPATPKIAWVAPAQTYTTSRHTEMPATEIDLCSRILSMGKMHHAYPGTAAIALGVAAAIPHSVVYNYLPKHNLEIIRLGHAAGKLEVNAVVKITDAKWIAEKAIMLRSARTLMRGEVYIQD